MYYQYFGLAEAPFSIAVNPRYLYMSPRHRDALAHLLYGVGAGGGFILLTGEVGTGKTTINRCLLEQLPDHADVAVVLNPALDARDLLAAVCDELQLEFAAAEPGLKALTDALHKFLLSNHEKGRKTVLMIDEAQHLGFDVLEQIRLLTNLETNEEKLLHIILIGQPELAEKLRRPELRQLNQRITARFELEALTAPETGAYIRHRLHVAGMAAGRELFSGSLVRAVHRESGGIPRLINLLCDRMLLGAYGQGLNAPNRRLLRQAAKEVACDGESRVRPRPLVAAAAAMIIMVTAGYLALADRWDRSLRVEESNAFAGAATALAPQESETAPRERVPMPELSAQPQASAPPTDTVSDSWRLSPRESLTLLGSLYQQRFPGAGDNLCARSLAPGMRCVRAADSTWNELQREDRPALLRLVDNQRFESRIVFLGAEGNEAILAMPAGVARVDLGELAEDWTGEYWRLWRAPRALERTLQRGDRGDDVRYLATLFAELDGQDELLTETLFDARLEQRLMIFQERHGLEADGVLGEQTLRALSLAAGVDLNNARPGVLAQRGLSLASPAPAFEGS